jgi:dimethylargininase
MDDNERMRLALTRAVSPSITRCELTHLGRTPIDLARAEAQHAAYEQALRGLGCRVVRVAGAPDLPDAVFVEDTAIVLDEVAVITRPGAQSRRLETGPVADALVPYRELRRISAPGTLEGGDVLRAGKTLFVGRSSRTNDAGISQLREHVSAFGYTVVPLGVRDCLHLKSAVTLVAPDTFLLQPAWIARDWFSGATIIEVDPHEPFGANALLAGDGVIYPAAFPRTCARLEAHGVRVVAVDVSELAKAEGAVTCCSLVLEEVDQSASRDSAYCACGDALRCTRAR